ncbi:ATP-binding cassette domain-containing protein [Flavobacterium sp. Sd200]|uniref:ATP-binding cassette domain-containing protein n=1 Tax=Flavobacterium sp. Sd200 TaxID=2692211 RepID=UPI001370EA96|nr:ATP-binding cassette domain-containing protein [Flavobacterium sp. Sd200]MXN89863.1 ATP-binding cassette domain-containing protein [Flavobacterium sp. Sd200]
MPFLHFPNVTIKNNNTAVFTNLTFTIAKGEQWALTGKSGSGKTTLLEAIAGKRLIIGTDIIRPKNVVLVSPKPAFKNLANTSNFYYQQRFNSADAEDAQTVTEYLETAVKTKGKWTLDNVLDRLNLRYLADKEVIKLSNGETRRLLLAEALLKNPELLLLDSPLVGLDVQSRADFNMLLADITASGIQVVITATTEELPECITHVAVLDNCTVRQTLAAPDFKNNLIQQTSKAQLDQNLLQKLLNHNPIPPYEFIVNMSDVVIQYGDKTILDHVDWTILQGECWALSGHNGAGKSTLLSLINGDNPQAYANDIVLFDRKRGTGESIWEIKKNTGFVSPELFQYFPGDSSCSNVIESGLYDTLGLFRNPLPKNKELIANWMQLLGIEAYANTLFRNVSGAVQRSYLLARALIKNPPLLILDEPTQGMDDEQRENFKHLINTICSNSNVTLIYVSHYIQDIPECVTKKLVLEKGKAV